MTATVLEKEYYTFEEYLQLEEESGIRYEYHNGEVFAMAGTTKRHNLIVQNISWALRPQSRKNKCKAFSENIRFKYPFPSQNKYVYPDVIYTCNAKDLDDGTTIHSPSLIVEVLLSSTEEYDRGTKRDSYFRCPSLQCYLIVYQQIERVECYERANDFWKYRNFENINDTFWIESLDLTISLSDFYEDINITDADREAYIAKNDKYSFKD